MPPVVTGGKARDSLPAVRVSDPISYSTRKHMFLLPKQSDMIRHLDKPGEVALFLQDPNVRNTQ